jgi:hypothetical protein
MDQDNGRQGAGFLAPIQCGDSAQSAEKFKSFKIPEIGVQHDEIELAQSEYFQCLQSICNE